MFKLEARRDLIRTALTVCLGYVIALHLILVGLASTSHTVRSLDALTRPDPHALCLSGAASEVPTRTIAAGWPHHHDVCCTWPAAPHCLHHSFATLAFAAITPR